MKKEIVPISLKKTEKVINSLTKKYSATLYKYKNIYGIPRGGLVPAVMLSHKTGIPLTDKITKDTLLVDEICDSGKTRQKYKNDMLVLFQRYNAKHQATYIGELVMHDKWLKFFWELEK
jgi:uncharacterized protein